MIYTRPRGRDWALPAIVSFVIVYVSYVKGNDLGIGIGIIIALWSGMNFLHHAGTAIVDMVKEARPDRYRMSMNYQAELISKMSKDQLKAWGRIGNARVSVLVRKGRDSKPLFMLHGEDVSLEFLNYFLNQSTDRNLASVGIFFEDTHHWDWSQDNIISDREQAIACRTYLVRNGWAEWNGNGSAATWAMALDGNRWTPEDVRRVHGLSESEGEQDE